MRLVYWVCKQPCVFLWRTYCRGKAFGVSNVPKTGPVLLVSNHQSFLDPTVVGSPIKRHCHFMARDSLFRNPLFGKLISLCNAFPVRRGAADIRAVKECIRRLREGNIVMIFPEGTRSRDGSIGKINANSLAIAQRAPATIVPAVIDGSFDAFPRDKILPRPRPVHVTYCEAISTDDVCAWSVEQLRDVVTERMHKAMTESIARRTGKTPDPPPTGS